MSSIASHIPLLRRIRSFDLGMAAALLFAIGAAVTIAQIEGDRGVPPIASSGDFEVSGVKVDVAAPTADKAREAGWRLAQRLGWKKLWASLNSGEAPGLSDSQLDAIVSGIEIEKETIGPHRYIATLGVSFDRARAGQILGVSGSTLRSAPMLVIPIMWDGGVATTFEGVTEWQKAWARYRTGDSSIDYVRTTGDGPDSLLLNAAQPGRRSRTWWRVLLDQYGAADVLIPMARLERLWPGGPVIGHFAARYGPDNKFLGAFDMRAASPAGIPDMMDKAIARIDQIYAQALATGELVPDSSLIIEEPVEPANVTEAVNASDTVDIVTTAPPPPSTVAQSFSIQFDTPTAASVAQGEAAVKGIAGVRSALTNSLALGGTSVMAVSFEGDVEALRIALQARGFTVTGSGNTLRITRR